MFVSLPTGYGKSAKFAILPLLFHLLLGKTLHICYIDILYIIVFLQESREISLSCYTIDDGPTRKILQQGLIEEFINKAQTDEASTTNALNGNVQLVYTSLESFCLTDGTKVSYLPAKTEGSSSR